MHITPYGSLWTDCFLGERPEKSILPHSWECVQMLAWFDPSPLQGRPKNSRQELLVAWTCKTNEVCTNKKPTTYIPRKLKNNMRGSYPPPSAVTLHIWHSFPQAALVIFSQIVKGPPGSFSSWQVISVVLQKKLELCPGQSSSLARSFHPIERNASQGRASKTTGHVSACIAHLLTSVLSSSSRQLFSSPPLYSPPASSTWWVLSWLEWV